MAFVPSHRKKHKTGGGHAHLQLTSMMDMFTIILVFLLKTYSTHGQLIKPSPDLTLPSSVIRNEPEVGLDITITTDWMLVNGKKVIPTRKIEDINGYIIPGLRQELKRHADIAKDMEIKHGAKFSGKVTIQGDKSLPYRTLIKVMATCGQSDYPNMRLVVYQERIS